MNLKATYFNTNFTDSFTSNALICSLVQASILDLTG